MNKIIKNFRIFEIEGEIDIGIKVQIDIIGSIIQEWIDRAQIEEIKREFPAPENDPSFQ